MAGLLAATRRGRASWFVSTAELFVTPLVVDNLTNWLIKWPH